MAPVMCLRILASRLSLGKKGSAIFTRWNIQALNICNHFLLLDRWLFYTDTTIQVNLETLLTGSTMTRMRVESCHTYSLR